LSAGITSPRRQPDAAGVTGAPGRRLSILHLILVLGETNSQYNEHCLPQTDARDLAICTYFPPRLTPPSDIALFAGDGTLPGFFGALRSALLGRRYDVLHAHSPHTAVLLPLTLVLMPRFWGLWRAAVLTVHDSFHDYKPRNQAMTLAGLAVFRRVVFCSNAAFDSLPRAARAVTGRRARVVQNAADLGRVVRTVAGSSKPDDGIFRVVFVGRLEPVKDPLGMVAAFAASTDPGCRLQLVGTGSLEPDVRSDVEARGLAGQVQMTGLVARDEVFRLYGQGDLFVSVSRGEGLPVAVMEAMAAGMPVVLSDIPPHRELVDGLDAVPVLPLGDTEGFAREIARFRRMPADERREIGTRCREWVLERFTLEQMHAGYDHVYRQVLPTGGAR